MNDTIRQRFLDVHNELRAQVASGQAKDGLGGYAPQAAAMPKLTYDCNVEKGNTGENIYMRSPAYDEVKVVEDSSRSWFSELAEFGVRTDLILDDALWDRGVGHYTQMVWQSTTAIGCAVQSCPTMSFVVCNYSPPGNMIDVFRLICMPIDIFVLWYFPPCCSTSIDMPPKTAMPLKSLRSRNTPKSADPVPQPQHVMDSSASQIRNFRRRNFSPRFRLTALK
ncbi:unnamed protein product [Cylicocyclus nassatus]|uniref:SCP domain-containing protein n=1 Tax=Cylicocyclus nassatus TaxID=53992 RepID=A0AA36GH88_CYLNA|nr:unnamed protein product [Cylicocyclus nassatus]